MQRFFAVQCIYKCTIFVSPISECLGLDRGVVVNYVDDCTI